MDIKSGKKSKKGKVENIPDWKTLKLWKHQKAAVRMIEKYIAANKNEENPKTALIQMPSGTGKTGVAAVSSICLLEVKVVLILVPRSDLIAPMIKEIQKVFWTIIGVGGSSLKGVRRFQPPKVSKCVHRMLDESGVLVSTPQFVMTVTNGNKKENIELFDKLKKKVALVIIDGRHCHPLKNWGKMTDKLAKPTVLLKETLYRDDFRIFNIDRNYFYFYSYKEALEDKQFPRIEFKTGEQDCDMEKFAREVVLFFENKILPKSGPRTRVLIHCETCKDVKEMTNFLREIKYEAIGIHEHFDEKELGDHFYDHITKKVLDMEVIFWVLPLRLMKKFDFKGVYVLAVYNSFINDIDFVEQLGRFLRNCKCESRAQAYVYSSKSPGTEDVWERYLQYQQEFSERVKAIPPVNKKNGADALLAKHLIAESLPVDYIDGRFSREFDIFDPDAFKCLSLPHAAYINKMGEEDLPKSLDDYVKEIIAEWTDRERICAYHPISSHTKSRVILYYAYRNSPLLQPHCYFRDCKLGVTIFHWEKPYLFYYDSEGAVPFVISILEQQLTSVDIRKLLDKEDKRDKERTPRLSKVGLISSNLGLRSIRESSQRAFSFRETIHGPADHSFICKQAIGHIVKKGSEDEKLLRRDVGFLKKRVAETLEDRLSFYEYIQWLKDLAEILKESRRPSIAVLNRFARSYKPPENCEPAHILLDIFGQEWRFRDDNGKGKAIVIKDCGAEVRGIKPNKWFSYNVGGKNWTFGIKYDYEKNRYKLTQDELNSLYRDRYANMGVVAYLNRYQAFRVVPESSGIIYAFGEFFNPIICNPSLAKSPEENRVDLCSLFHEEGALSGVNSEKGKHCKTGGSGWENGCVFDLIDSQHATLFGGRLKDIDTLVCDDMGTEVADFIAAKEGNNHKDGFVIFIHAKAFKRPIINAASKLADVCSQAIKNLGYIDRFSHLKPKNMYNWSSPWRSGGIGGQVKYRIRKPVKWRKKPENVWNHIKKILHNPLSRIEVWIVMGNGHSKSELNTLLNPPPPQTPSPETIQNIYQLESTWSIVASMGATLRIFSRQ